MSRSDEKRLNDIRRMCATAAGLVERGRAAIESDPALWLALERVLEIAGEAATNTSDETRSQHPEVPWRELAATRVLLAHADHRVDLDLLWDIAERDLADLAQMLGPVDKATSDGRRSRCGRTCLTADDFGPYAHQRAAPLLASRRSAQRSAPDTHE